MCFPARDDGWRGINLFRRVSFSDRRRRFDPAQGLALGSKGTLQTHASETERSPGMSQHQQIAATLEAKLAELLARSREIRDELRHELDADSSEQAVDLADDEALAGVDDVLRREISEIRQALLRIENGSYGSCANCGNEIGENRLKALPTATRCINCA
jgi:RNA polymerase-binding protein DksA